MNDREDQAVDRVMAGLRAAQPPDGMEQRVLQALRSRENAAARSPKHRDGVGRRSWMAAAAAAIVAVGALLAMHGHETARSPAKRQSIAAAPPANSIPEAVEVRLPAPAIARKRSSQAVGHVEMARSTRAGRGVREVSYPAPVQPLTAQEKALLQIAQHAGPAEIALLDPVVRAKQEALEDAKFEKFVNQSDQGTEP